MALQSETSRIQYNGNNSTTASYAVPFYFFENSHIKAVVTNSSGVDTTLSLGSGFSLTGAGNVTGGTLTTTTAVPSSSKLTIYREVPVTQTTSYAEGGDFPAASHERALDKLTMLVQQTKRIADRSLKVSESQTSPNDLPNAANGYRKLVSNNGAISWDTDANIPSPPNTGLSVALSNNGSIAWQDHRPLPQYPIGAGPFALLTAGAGQPASWGTMPTVAVGPITATGSDTPRLISDREADQINVLDFGADPTGVTNSHTQIQNAINAASNGDQILFPKGIYRIGARINIPFSKTGLKLHGNATLKAADGYFPQFFRIAGEKTTIDGLRFDGSFVAGTTPSRTSYSVAVNNSANFADKFHAIEINGIDITVKHCELFNIQGRGITAQLGVGAGVATYANDSFYGSGSNRSVAGTRIENNKLSNVYMGIVIQSTLDPTYIASIVPPSDFIISGNTVKNNSWEVKGSYARCIGTARFAFSGTPAAEIQNITVANNICITGGTTGIELYAESRNAIVANNFISGGDIAISMGGADDFSVTGNVAIGARDYCIEMANSSNGTITGNYMTNRKIDNTLPLNTEADWAGSVYGNSLSGISMSNAETLRNITISGNVAKEVISAIFCNTTLDNCNITGNVFESRLNNSASNVIQIQGSCNRNVNITNNIIRADSSNVLIGIRFGSNNIVNVPWVASTTFTEGQYAHYTGGPVSLNGLYYCKQTHTSAANFSTDWNNGSGKWNLVSKGWASGVVFTEFDTVVDSNGISYKVIAPHTATTLAADIASNKLALAVTRDGVISHNTLIGPFTRQEPILLENAQGVIVTDNSPLGSGDRTTEITTNQYLLSKSGGMPQWIVDNNVGTAQISGGQSSVVVSHGLEVAPDINVTPLNAMGDANKWWVDSIDGANFAIRVSPTLAAGQTAQFRWEAKRHGFTGVQAWMRVPANSATGWSRLIVPKLNHSLAQAEGYFASNGFTFECRLIARAESGFVTTVYFGGTGNEEGQALTARGLRVSLSGNNTNYDVAAAIHNGSSETIGTGISSPELRSISISWQPITVFGGTVIPNTGSRLIVTGEFPKGNRKVLAVSELNGPMNGLDFASNNLVVVVRKNLTSPTYSVPFEIGGMKFIRTN